MLSRIFILSLLIVSYTQCFSQTLSNTNLPIVIINTDGNFEIPDDPKILGKMKIVYNGAGVRNLITDSSKSASLNYNGRISIEQRGSSSTALPKKQYSFSTKMNDGILNNDVSLLGLPIENDWILNGLAFDASLMRDYIAYNLARKLGDYCTRTVYCEVIINGEYKGLYILQEKVKAGKNRVDINKISIKDVVSPGVTGGYITKVDRTSDIKPAFLSLPTYSGNYVDFMHEVPSIEEAVFQQTNYLKDEVFGKLVSASSTYNSSFIDGYPSIICVPTFIDYMLINELGSNVDAYQLSTYFHKEKNGKLRAGPTWDHNLTFGNDLTFWGYDRSKTDVWQFSNNDNTGAMFWKDLFDDVNFKCYMAKRFAELTAKGKPFNQVKTDSLIDATYSYILEASVRENYKWGTASNIAVDAYNIKNWLTERVSWMKTQLGSYTACSNVALPSLVITKIMYNPNPTLTYPIPEDLEYIEIKNIGNTTVDLTGIYFRGTGFIYQFPTNSTLSGNTSIKLAGNKIAFNSKYSVAPFGQYTRSLSNTNENLLLADGFGNVIDQVNYSSSAPWPNANANGFYLKLRDTQLDNNLYSSWDAIDESITQIDDLFIDNEKVSISPNPILNIATINTLKNIDNLEVLDIQGKVIKSISGFGNKINLDLSDLNNGLYMIKLTSVNESIIMKVVKE
jgi:hypothetical protein